MSNSVLSYSEIQGLPRTHSFMVFAETAPGAWVNVYKGADRDRAVSTANFWDERVNVEFIDRYQEAAIQVAKQKQEEERRSHLPFDVQLSLSLADQVAKINEAFDELASRY